MRGGIYVLNFYSTVFVDQLKRGRKTATIRLGDKTSKYERGQVVWITVGFRHSPREKIFAAVIDDVEVKKVADLSPRDIEHDNPEFRRLEDEVKFLEQIYGRTDRPRRRRHRDPLLADSRAARARTSATGRRRTTTERALPPMADYAFLTTWLLDCPREPVWEAIYDQERWPRVVARGGGGGGTRRRATGTGVGAVARMEWRSLLPYRVEFEITTTHVERPHLLQADAVGELAGVGRWRLFEREGVTAVLYEWNVATTKAWMNLLAPVARPVFEWNHDWVMARGGEGIADLLGCKLLANGQSALDSVGAGRGLSLSLLAVGPHLCRVPTPGDR